jgi:hypothetical protein
MIEMQRDKFFFALSKTEQYEPIDFTASIHEQRYFKVPSPLSKKNPNYLSGKYKKLPTIYDLVVRQLTTIPGLQSCHFPIVTPRA